MNPLKILFILILALLASCSLGTKTIYKREGTFSIQKIGFSNPEKDTAVAQLFPQTDSVFQISFTETFSKKTNAKAFFITNVYNYEKPDYKSIKELCILNEWDAFVVSRIKFIHVTYTFSLIPVAKSWDTEVEMKVIDKDGKVILIVSHNTLKGNSYAFPPKADKTIFDGTEGALKRILKEIN